MNDELAKSPAIVRKLVRAYRRWKYGPRPNEYGVLLYPPGHYYSPLLDIESFGLPGSELTFDGPEYWQTAGLSLERMKAFYLGLIEKHPWPEFPAQATEGWRYFSGNEMFSLPDAFTLSALIREAKPQRVIEVGSGFSSAVMLDTCDRYGIQPEMTFIEPHAERLKYLLSPADRQRTRLIEKRVQEVPVETFDDLGADDILFIDSSHVAKVGSDVVFLLLRVLPRLKPGVLVHVHDIFYPESYPSSWLKQGRAWNESIMLRAFLTGNRAYEVIAFNAFMARECPEIFRERFPEFLVNQESVGLEMGKGGASLWMRKTQ